MTTSTSMKARIFSSASLFTLSMGIVAQASAQSAPDPLPLPPAPPTPPTIPALEGCSQDGSVVTCVPGLDFDGFVTTDDDLTVTVEEGAQVENTLEVSGARNNIAINGNLLDATATNALVAGDSANISVSVSGFIQTSGDAGDAVVAGADAVVVNDGTVSTNSSVADANAFELANGATISNNALIQTNGSDASGVAAGSGAAVNNAVTGTIVTVGDGSAGVEVAADAAIQNDGLLQTFGDGASGLVVGNNSNGDNTGNLVTSGAGSTGVLSGDGFVFTNSGVVETTGAGSDGVVAGDDADVTNSGSISAGGRGLVVGANASLDNSGTIAAAGGNAVEAGDGLTATNTGRIATTSLTASALVATGDVTLTNAAGGEIVSGGGDAVVLAGGADTIVNFGAIDGNGGGAALLGAGDDAFQQWQSGVTQGLVDGGAGDDTLVFGNDSADQITRSLTAISDPAQYTGFETIAFLDIGGGILLNGDGSVTFTVLDGDVQLAGSNTETATISDGLTFTVTPDGSIATADAGETAIDAGEMVTIINNGNLSTAGTNAFGISVGDDSSVTSTGSIATTGDGSTSVIAGANASVENSGSIDTTGANAAGISVGDGSTITNTATGSIATTGANSAGVLIAGAGELTNAGMIDTAGAGSLAVSITGDATVTNSGSITTMAAGALELGGLATITNTDTGIISAMGGNAVTLGTEGSTVTNDGTIETSGANNSGIVGGAELVITNNGTISTAGDNALGIDAGDNLTLTNSGEIIADDRAVNIGDNGTITNEAGGTINTTGDADTIQSGENLTILNNGTIQNDGFDTKIVDADDGLTFTNNGLVTSDWKGIEGEANFTLTNNAGARIFSAFDEAIEADGPGLVVINDGEIVSPEDDAIDGGDDVTITNTGLIQGGQNDGLELNSGTITNSGIIESLSSDPDGDFILDAMGNPTTGREIDAGIDFDGGTDGNEDGVVTNNAGGIIRGDIGINTSSGATGSDANEGAQQVVNFGAIEGRAVNPETGRIDAVLLGAGDDEFQQWTGASVSGWIDLQAGDDVFILEGQSSSVTAQISGGSGNDIAILAGTLDSDNFTDFETYQLGSQLGGSLNDLVIRGDRVLNGDVIHVGEATLRLGVDTLTVTGSIVLDETGVLNIETPLDEQLLGQTVLVLEDGTGFTDNGATLNIIDDDLFLAYTPVIGSLSVAVSAANPFADSPDSDPNLAALGGAIATAANAGTISSDNFAALNSLGTVETLSSALSQTLPSLSEGVGREIFETSNTASQILDRHLGGEGSGIWGQFVVRGAEQDARSASIEGYESDQLVFTVGGDFLALEGTRIGLLASYADINVDDETSTGAPGERSEIESIKLGAYLSVSLFDSGFFNAEFSYLTGEVEAGRGGTLGPISSAYDFDGFATRATLGYDLLPDENISLTPTIGVNAASIGFDDTVESGGFGFAVERANARFVEGRAGVELGATVSENVSGFVQGTVVREFIDDPRSFRLTSSELQTILVQLGDRQQDRFELAAGADVELSPNTSIELGYQGEFVEGYSVHSARATVRIGF
ncbi:MAG: autotransporter domain-containing protein [Erythrobacter sp.]